MATNSCEFIATSYGIGDFVVSSSPAGRLTPEASNVIDGKTYTYLANSYDSAVPPNVTAWESGSGAYIVSTRTLQRTTIVANSNGDLNPVNFVTPPIVDMYPSPAGTLERIAPPRSYLAGLTLSWISVSFFGVAAGSATDSTNSFTLTLNTAMTKFNNPWAVGTGTGCLDTGSNTANTWYFVFIIQRVDTGVEDILTSLSPTAPTLPANYTLFRRIGAVKTSATGTLLPFVQDGDKFQWDVPVLDVNVVNPGTSAVTRTMSTPLGIRVEGLFNVGYTAVTAATDNPAMITLSDLSVTDTGALSPKQGSFSTYSALIDANIPLQVFTNLLSQIRSRVQLSTAGLTIYIQTFGWIDRRGRDT